MIQIKFSFHVDLRLQRWTNWFVSKTLPKYWPKGENNVKHHRFIVLVNTLKMYSMHEHGEVCVQNTSTYPFRGLPALVLHHRLITIINTVAEDLRISSSPRVIHARWKVALYRRHGALNEDYFVCYNSYVLFVFEIHSMVQLRILNIRPFW